MNELYQTWNHVLTDLDQDWLIPEHLEEFVTAVHNRGAALENCWGFIDDNVRPLCRLGRNQMFTLENIKQNYFFANVYISSMNARVCRCCCCIMPTFISINCCIYCC